MANLRGNIQDCNDEVDDADAEEGTGGEKAVKKTTKRNYSDKTIEKNPENLNAVKIESEHIADPLFHRMSKAFDEGGAKGMLMTNLVSYIDVLIILILQSSSQMSSSTLQL